MNTKHSAPIAAILTAQIAALELMYQHERRCDKARWILDEIAAKRDLLALEKTKELIMTTPFPAGSAVEKTDDEYYCNACYCIDVADHIPATGSITCRECDSENVVSLKIHRESIRAKRDEFFAKMDAEASE